MMYGSTQDPEADVQGGQVKLHEDTLKNDKKRGREKGISRQNEPHM